MRVKRLPATFPCARCHNGEYEVKLVDENLGFTKREKFRVWK